MVSSKAQKVFRWIFLGFSRNHKVFLLISFWFPFGFHLNQGEEGTLQNTDSRRPTKTHTDTDTQARTHTDSLKPPQGGEKRIGVGAGEARPSMTQSASPSLL